MLCKLLTTAQSSVMYVQSLIMRFDINLPSRMPIVHCNIKIINRFWMTKQTYRLCKLCLKVYTLCSYTYTYLLIVIYFVNNYKKTAHSCCQMKVKLKHKQLFKLWTQREGEHSKNTFHTVTNGYKNILNQESRYHLYIYFIKKINRC